MEPSMNKTALRVAARYQAQDLLQQVIGPDGAVLILVTMGGAVDLRVYPSEEPTPTGLKGLDNYIIGLLNGADIEVYEPPDDLGGAVLAYRVDSPWETLRKTLEGKEWNKLPFKLLLDRKPSPYPGADRHIVVIDSHGDTMKAITKVLKAIKNLGDVGHSTSVDIDGKAVAGVDGDGSDRIDQILIDGKDIDKLASKVVAKLSPHQRGWEHRRENDERAQYNIPPEYHGLWNKLKSQFKGTPDQRAEQFMEYVEEHPDENIDWLQSHADREVAKMTREFEREQRELARKEKECDKWQEKYENAWYKEQERQTQEKRKLKRLQERAESVCQSCPTCPEYEEVPFAASASRVAARYKSKKKLDSGNTIYEYSERQVANRNRKKAEQIAKLEKRIGELRKRVQRDLKSDDPDKFLTALAVALMDHTYERVGNDESASEGHFGVTGWQRKHVSFGRGKAKVRYVGKSGVKHEKVVSDKSLVAALRDAYEAMDGDDTGIFEYEGGKIDARKVNAYLKPFDVTAKDIRGLHANREMRERLSKIRKGALPEDPKEREAKLKDEFKQALEATAEAVGHEAATLRSQYLVPGLEEAFLKDGTVTKGKKAAYPFWPGLSDPSGLGRLMVKRCMKTAMNLRDIEITADKAEDILQGLIEGIDDLEEVERKLGLDIRNMTSLMRQFDHNADEYHNGEDVLTHTKWVLEDVQELTEGMDDERKLVIRLAALMHDLGKAYTFEVQEDGSHTFRKHAEKSVVLVEALLKRHRKDLGDLYQRVVDLVEKHDAFMVLLNARKDAKGLRYLNKFMRGAIYMGGHIEDLMTLAKADGNRSKVRQQTLDDIEAVLADIKQVERQREEEAKAKEALAREFERRLPEIQALLEAEGLSEAAGAGTLSEINAILGKNKRYDLIKRIRSMLGG
jgi:putative nucleotidyltransferase with HDIG domain